MDPIARTGPETLSGPCLVRVTGEACPPGRAVRPARASSSLEQGEREPQVSGKQLTCCHHSPGPPCWGSAALLSRSSSRRASACSACRHPGLQGNRGTEAQDLGASPSPSQTGKTAGISDHRHGAKSLQHHVPLPSHFHSAPPSFRIHTFSFWKMSSRSYSRYLQPPRLQLPLRIPDFHQKPSDDFRAEAEGWGGWLSLAVISHAPRGHRLCPHRPHPAQVPPAAQGFHPHLKEGSYTPGDPITVLR